MLLPQRFLAAHARQLTVEAMDQCVYQHGLLADGYLSGLKRDLAFHAAIDRLNDSSAGIEM